MAGRYWSAGNSAPPTLSPANFTLHPAGRDPHEAFAYDHRDRLTHAWTTGSATAAYDESYEYTAIGNLDKKGPTGSPVAYGYNPSGAGSVRPHAATSVGGAVYAYDANGNMTSRTGKAITWNVDNTVASVVGPDNVPEGYTYDVNGQRVTRSRNLGQPGGFTTVYVGGLYEEDTPSGDKRLLYTFAGRVVAQRTIVGGSGTGTVAYLHGDLLGSTGATTSGGGGVTATQRSTPFGSVRAGGGLPTTIGFTGQRQDGTGLLFYNARYYDPSIGRFASADTTGVEPGLPQTLNRYSYVKNNPVRYTDPTGHDDRDPGGAAPLPERCARSLDCDVDTINAMTWDERIAFVELMDYLYGLGGWFNNVLGILEYFRDSPTFQDSERMKLEDAVVIEVIQRGLRGSIHQSNVGDDAAGDWKNFFDNYFGGDADDHALRGLWGTAEQHGVNQAQATSAERGVYFTTPAQEAAYTSFLFFGNVYRASVTQNQPLYAGFWWWPTDPRNDRYLVRKYAEAFELGYCAAAPEISPWLGC